MQLEEWVDAAGAELGLAGSVDVELLLDLARDVAHAVERRAAPVTTYLLGLAVAGGATPSDAAAALRRALP